MRRQKKLTNSYGTDSGPTAKTQEVVWTGIWTAAGATDIAGQRAVLPDGGIQKERVIVPWAGGRHLVIGVFRFRRSGFPIMRVYIGRAHSGLLFGLVHRFWAILG